MYSWYEDSEGNEVKGEQMMTQNQADALIEKHIDVFDRCKLMGSFAYYTANQIREAEAKQ